MVDPLAMHLRSAYWLPLGVLLALPSCSKEQQHERTSEPVASVDKNAGLDPELARAVAAASSRAKPTGAPDSSGGPPPNGIFPPGGADAEIKPGAPPKITLGGTGSEPRVSLAPAQPKPGWKTQGTIQLQVSSGPQQAPIPFELTVAIEAQKPKGAAADAGAPSDSVAMTAKVLGVKLGLSGIPHDLELAVAKLKGSKVEYEVSHDGAGTGFHTEVAPGAESVRDQLRQLSDALALVTLPVPSEPLGTGAYWMTTSREGVFGLDLVTYRLVKVEAVKGDSVTLSVGTKRYATSKRFDFEGLPPDAPHELSEFQCKSEGKLVMQKGTPFPQSGDLDSGLLASLPLPGQENQAGTLQVQTHVTLDFAKH
jgi:hypothetical protein